MSDTNDKKPGPVLAGWHSPENGGATNQPRGHGAEDPLAELDRIVNQDSGRYSADPATQGSISTEDLLTLEQDLIRELRGQQEPMAPAPQVGAASQPSYPAPEPAIPPMPMQPQAEPVVAVPPVSVPDATPGPAADYAPVPAVATPVEAAPANAVPNLDDWSKLFENPVASQATPQDPQPAPMPSVSVPQPEPQPAPMQDSFAAAPAYSDDVARTGSYGQLTPSGDDLAASLQAVEAEVAAAGAAVQSQAFVDKLAEPARDPMADFAAGQPYQAPVEQPIAPMKPVYEQPAPAAPTYEPVAPLGSAMPAEPVAPAPNPVPSPAPMASSSVPEPTAYVPGTAAGMAPGDVNDPYAAFNQAPSVDPAPAYQPIGGAAPAVDVTGQTADYYAETPAQPDPAMMAHPAGQMGADYAAASGPHGTYSDPNVALADAESRPYAEDTQYQGLDHGVAEGAAMPPAKSRKGLVAATSALAVVVVGGLAIWGFAGSSGDNTETPVIVANNDPVKEAPEDPGGKVIPHQNKEVYDRIDGTKTDEGPSNLMPATEKPLALTADGKQPRVISLSGGETSVPQGGGQAANSSSGVSPKKVRTVIVRPDGTIVTSNAGESAATRTASVDQELLNTTPSEQAMNQTFNNGVQGLGANNGVAGAGAGAASSALAALPRAKPAELVALQAAQRQAAATQPAIAPVTQPTAPTSPQPLSLVPQSGNSQARVAPAAPVVQSSGGGGYTVQVTSQRTPEQAQSAYASIQSRLSGVLSGYQPDIKRADLGARGTYYRVRVGSFADRGGATALCQSIKASGGDCLVAKK